VRLAAKIDANQRLIVSDLRKMQGVTVAVGHDDVLIGYKGVTYWFEIKRPETVGKTGEVRNSEIKSSQQHLLDTWTGHYKIVWNIEQIREEIGL